MCDVEYHTVCYLRDMLVTPSHRDDDVSAFMTMWNREEFWHGEALADVLGAHGVTVDFDELKAKRISLGWKDRLDPVKQSLMGNIVGKDFVAVHMIWGAVNEWSAIAAYNRLADLEKHPVLAELLPSHRQAGGAPRGLLRQPGPRAPRQQQEGPGPRPPRPAARPGVLSGRASWRTRRSRTS